MSSEPRITSTNVATSGLGYKSAALLTLSDTTVTAFKVPSTTGLLVVDGTTLTWREEGITLSNGVVISAGWDDLEDKTTTASIGPISTASNSMATSTSGVYTIETINSAGSATTLRSASETRQGTTGASSASSTASGASASSSSSSAGLAPMSTLGAGKTLALIGAVGGMLALGL